MPTNTGLYAAAAMLHAAFDDLVKLEHSTYTCARPAVCKQQPFCAAAVPPEGPAFAFQLCLSNMLEW